MLYLTKQQAFNLVADIRKVGETHPFYGFLFILMELLNYDNTVWASEGE